MSDQEIVKMAAFRLRICANRVLQLAREAGSSPLGNHLNMVAADLFHREGTLRTGAADDGDGGNGGVVPE